MGFGTSVNTVPLWFKVLAPLLVICIGAAATIHAIKDSELPENAKPHAIEARFSKQIEALEELAMNYSPPPAHSMKKVRGKSDPDKVEVSREIKREAEEIQSVYTRIKEKLAKYDHLFVDPAIVGVQIYYHPSRFSTIRESIKVECSSRRFTGNQKLIKYEKVMLDPAGKKRGFRLVIDLNLIEGDPAN